MLVSLAKTAIAVLGITIFGASGAYAETNNKADRDMAKVLINYLNQMQPLLHTKNGNLVDARSLMWNACEYFTEVTLDPDVMRSSDGPSADANLSNIKEDLLSDQRYNEFVQRAVNLFRESEATESTTIELKIYLDEARQRTRDEKTLPIGGSKLLVSVWQRACDMNKSLKEKTDQEIELAVVEFTVVAFGTAVVYLDDKFLEEIWCRKLSWFLGREMQFRSFTDYVARKAFNYVKIVY